MNKRVNKPKTRLEQHRASDPSPSAAKRNNAAAETGKNRAVPGDADPHDPLLVLVRHTYAHRVCHPHVA